MAKKIWEWLEDFMSKGSQTDVFPTEKNFKNVIDYLRTYGLFKKPKRNRNKPARGNAINVNEVLATVNGNPHVSTVTISAATNISAASVRRTLKENGYHDYRMV
ncbi:hypothetical protein HHI36_006182 [Cryptolaemus montrouzieri]|uniref:Transposase n=1 Tax=Cryptolaemus montrouzieri TaxID=559131 RepID=A0ABD2NXS0_9CUCU